MSIVYSPLCNTSESAYYLYCLANYGAGINVSESVDGEGVDKGYNGRGGGVGKCSGLVGGGRECPWSAWLAVTGLHDSVSRLACSSGGFIESGSGCESAVGRISSGGVGGSVGGDVSSHGDDVTFGDTSVTVGFSNETVVNESSDTCVGGTVEFQGSCGSGVGNSGSTSGSVTGGLKRGKNFLRNKANREAKARAKLARKEAGGDGVDQKRVPEWRRKVVVEKTEAQKSLEEKWTIKNRLDTLKLKEQLRVQEVRAGNPRLFAPKVWTEDDEKMAYETKMAKLKSDKAKYVADEAYWKKRAEKGAVEKAIDLEIEIMDGQLSGKYDVFADKRTIGWAKTVKTNSSASSGANKTVWSGSGASKVGNTRSSVEHSIVSIEKHEELLKRLAVTESELIKVTEEARKYKTLGARAAAALKKQQKDKDEQEQWENSLYY